MQTSKGQENNPYVYEWEICHKIGDKIVRLLRLYAEVVTLLLQRKCHNKVIEFAESLLNEVKLEIE